MIVLLVVLVLLVLTVVFYGRTIILALKDEKRKVSEYRNIQKFLDSDNNAE